MDVDDSISPQKLTILAQCFFGFFCVEITAKFNDKISKISRIYIGIFLKSQFLCQKMAKFRQEKKTL
jgi:hypothetical protein